MKSGSENLFQRACQHIPGGVNSPVRAFKAVAATPVYLNEGHGARVRDVDGNEYLDFCGSWGPLILGHAKSEVVEAVRSTAIRGLTFGACNPLEVEFAELFCSLVPQAEMVRTVNSGTEAVMTALRLARAVTGRTHIVKFDGCYHGHSDAMLIAAGSGLLTNAVSASAGVTGNAIAEVLSTPYNNLEQLEQIFTRHGNSIAALIVEPVAGNMGLVMPDPGFLAKLREICDRYGSCLIFDEVITGFRFLPGAYAQIAGVIPDLSTFGKIIGGGMPVGAIAGARRIMEHLAPAGSVYQAGTLSGNPVALAAGIATLKLLRDEPPYKRITAMGLRLADGINRAAARLGVEVHCAVCGGVFTLYFSKHQPIRNLDDLKSCDTQCFAAYFRYMLAAGFYLPPSQFELNFISAAHAESDIDAFIAAAVSFLETLK